MVLLGFLITVVLFFHYKRRLEQTRGRETPEHRGCDAMGGARWRSEWQRHWAEKFQRQAELRFGHFEQSVERRRRRALRQLERLGLIPEQVGPLEAPPIPDNRWGVDREILRRARKRAQAEVGYHTHLMTFLGGIAFLSLLNLVIVRDQPWFIYPTVTWGVGLFSHYMAVFGARLVKERYFYPAVDREVRREKVAAHTEKQATIDELSATIAHEIRNPVAAAKSLVQQMAEDPLSTDNVEYAKVALEELDRVERQVSHLLKYAKEEEYSFGRVNLVAVVESALTQMRARLESGGVRIGRSYGNNSIVLADGERLRQVFSNILDNAIDALVPVSEAPRIDVSIESDGRRATVRLRDNGCGIPADRIDRIFNPFFTTKEHGTGLGMAIAKKIVEAHEGSIDVVSEAGRGTEFLVTLPVHH